MKDPGQYLADMRASAPLVQNITNYVAMNIMANAMLAAGASPAMVHAREEAAEFAEIAEALTVNTVSSSVASTSSKAINPDWISDADKARFQNFTSSIKPRCQVWADVALPMVNGLESLRAFPEPASVLSNTPFT